MRKTHFATASSLLVLCSLATCAEQAPQPDDEARHRFRDGGVTRAVDAAASPSPVAGTVSCYTEGAPATTCTLPEHCCFSNYSAQHDGSCETASCGYGTITCDGPEDCGHGESCCAHAIIDPDDGLRGYTVACQASACGAAPVDQELCHPTGPACRNGGTCVTTYGADNDLPRTLSICQ
jgi:hypothetical protein